MYSLKNFEVIAKEYINGKTDTLEGIETRLTAWYCITFNTTFHDPKLLEMTLEELIILYYMHLLKNNPELLSEEEKDEYEEWLKKQMGNKYVSEDQMVQHATGYEEAEKKRLEEIKNRLPEKITTDFSAIRGE